MMEKEKILISSCLLGEPVRYNGVHVVHPLVDALRERYELVPVCPEVMGGLPTPRPPAEIQGSRVVDREGRDVTAEYQRGAEIALKIALEEGIKLAVFQERSPSCGSGLIHDGTFTSAMVEGDGVCSRLLLDQGIRVIGDSRLARWLAGGDQEE